MDLNLILFRYDSDSYYYEVMSVTVLVYIFNYEIPSSVKYEKLNCLLEILQQGGSSERELSMMVPQNLYSVFSSSAIKRYLLLQTVF